MSREDKLLQKMEQGDSGAAEELIKMFYPEILRYCLWHAPDRSLAEDAVQETFLKFIRYFDRYTHRGKCRAFLYQIAANTCIDLQRKYSRENTALEEAEPDAAYWEPGFERAQGDMAIRQLVRRLPKEQQEIILLRFGQDLTIRETANVVKLPLRTVQSRLRAALKQLKKELEKEAEDYGK